MNRHARDIKRLAMRHYLTEVPADPVEWVASLSRAVDRWPDAMTPFAYATTVVYAPGVRSGGQRAALVKMTWIPCLGECPPLHQLKVRHLYFKTMDVLDDLLAFYRRWLDPHVTSSDPEQLMTVELRYTTWAAGDDLLTTPASPQNDRAQDERHRTALTTAVRASRLLMEAFTCRPEFFLAAYEALADPEGLALWKQVKEDLARRGGTGKT